MSILEDIAASIQSQLEGCEAANRGVRSDSTRRVLVAKCQEVYQDRLIAARQAVALEKLADWAGWNREYWEGESDVQVPADPEA